MKFTDDREAMDFLNEETEQQRSVDESTEGEPADE